MLKEEEVDHLRVYEETRNMTREEMYHLKMYDECLRARIWAEDRVAELECDQRAQLRGDWYTLGVIVLGWAAGGTVGWQLHGWLG